MAAARTHLSLRSRLGLIFATISLLLLSVVAVGFVEIGGIRLDTNRVSEESREAQIAQAIVLDLRGIQRIQGLRRTIRASDEEGLGDQLGLQDQAGHLSQAISSLRSFSAGPHGNDPSEHGHQASEDQILDELAALLVRLRGSIEAGESYEAIEPTLAEAMRRATVLADETHEESSESLDTLNYRAEQLLQATLIAVPIALIVLAAVYMMFSRAVIKPVLELQRGATKIGTGDLDHRIHVRSRDEIGSLCGEINRMADRIQEDHEELEERVQERTRQLIRAGRLVNLGTIAAGIAHEINNPLASIASCAEGLQARLKDNELGPEVQEEYLAIIAKEAYRARQIGERLLDLARHEPIDSQPLDLAKGIQETNLLLKHEFAARTLELITDIEPDLPSVQGNEREWKQILLNLLSNAIDASPEHSKIRLSCRNLGDHIRVVIEDEGGGITKQNIDQVFDPFFTTKSPDQGTGMGLAIVDSIVDRHAGEIKVKNTAKGARFIITFPIPDHATP